MQTGGESLNNRTNEQLRPINTTPQNESGHNVPTQPQESFPKRNEVPRSVIIIKLLLAILAVLAAAALISFLFCEYTFEYTGTVLPTHMSELSADIPSEALSEADIAPDSDTLAYYDFTLPVPESAAVDYEYFSDTVFIGDSRTKGLLTHTKITPYDFSSVGLNVSSLQTKAYIRLPDENGDLQSYKLIEALEREKDNYKAVYIATGLNELGWPTSGFMKAFGELIDAIRGVTDVPIYVQLIIPVTTASSESSQFGITNSKCVEFNEQLRTFISERELFMLDPTSLFIMEDGTLDPAHSSDGIHLNISSCEILADYYRTHTVDIHDYENAEPFDDAEMTEVPSDIPA